MRLELLSLYLEGMKALNKSLDQFYTSPEVARECFAYVDHYEGVYLEPCAGTGSFYHLFPENRRRGLDIDPKIDVEAADFLTWTPELLDVITVSNPPFGKNSSLAVSFFNKAAQFSRVIAFIVPRTFKKKRLVNRLDPSFHLVREVAVPPHAFIFNSQPYDVPCVFQVWERKGELRSLYVIPESSPDFTFTTSAEASFSCQRVGARAGLIRLPGEMENFSPQSNLFIRPLVPGVLEIFNQIDFTRVKFNTAGNPSISPGEIFELYEEAKGKQRSNLKEIAHS